MYPPTYFHLGPSNSKPVLFIETVLLAVMTFQKFETSTLNRKPVQLIRPVLLIEQYF